MTPTLALVILFLTPFYVMGWFGAMLALEQNRGTDKGAARDAIAWPWLLTLALVKKGLST